MGAWASLRTAWATQDLVKSTSSADVTLEDIEATMDDDDDSKEGKRRKRQKERERKKKEREEKRKNKKKKKKKKDDDDDANMISQDDDNDVEQRNNKKKKDDDSDDEGKGEDKDLTKEDEDDKDRYHWLFHLIMAFGAVYVAMLLSDWGNGTGMTREENDATAYTAMWVNAIGSWCAYFLFMWIRFAPICCPGRDFNMERENF